MSWRPGLLALALAAVGFEASAAAPPGEPSLQDAIAKARERVFPTLVNIQPVFDYSLNGRKIESMATGSGAIIRADGLVVTNFHVAGTAKRMICTLSDRRKCNARVVGTDAPTDLTLIQLELSELGLDHVAFAEFNDALPVEGDFVIAMGSPLGLTRSLSFGVVSCSQRFLGELRLHGGSPTGLFNTWIQTDAAINPGNSGGPLVDLSGRIVGINARGFDKADNLGFAIPARVVREIVDRLQTSKNGTIDRSEIGISIQALPPSKEKDHGAVIASVEPGSPAARAGIRAGDRLLAFGADAIDVHFDEDIPGALRTLTSLPIGADVDVTIGRGKERELLKLATIEWKLPAEEDEELAEFGLTVRPLAPDETRRRFLKCDAALLLTGARPGSALDRTTPKLKVGDVLLAVDEAPLPSPAALRSALAAASESSIPVVLKVARGRAEWRIALRPESDKSPATKLEGGER